MTEQVFGDQAALAAGIAERLVAELARLQAEGREPQLCLTGGGIASSVYRRLGTDGLRAPVDWTRVDLWWGDERYVPVDSTERNDTAALTALAPLGIAPHRVHRMPAPGADAGDLDAAAAEYAEELGDAVFDICLLGVGPDGHVASLFPDHPSSRTPGRVVAVREAPKPPPERISLTLDVINASAQVWFCVSGAEKADAVAWSRGGERDVPAARARGRDRSVWLLDEAAARRR